MVEIASSFLNVNEENIIKTIYDLEVANVDYFHIDVMDGKFVKNDTTEKMRKYTEYIKNISNIPIDVHLMVEDINSYVEMYLAMDVNSISFQIEPCKNEKQIIELIKKIKDNNCKVGLVISPNTPISKILECLPYIHKVIVMTVEPGKGGQKLIEDTITKIFELNKFIYENGYEVDIEVDGGINNQNAHKLTDVGANILVVGSYLVESNDYKKAILELKQK